MIKRLFILVLLISFFKVSAQNSLCEPKLPYQINTSSGMKMRAGPGTNFDVVIYVPAKSILLVCQELSNPATIEDIQGHWRRVKYKGKYGFMFDGFLDPIEPISSTPVPAASFKMAQLLVINKILTQDITKLDSVIEYLAKVARLIGYEDLVGPARPDRDSLFTGTAEKEEIQEEETYPPAMQFKFLTEAYNYCGDINELDPGKLWYAIYRQGEQYLMKRVELLIVRSKYSLSSKLEFDIKTEQEISASFLISADKALDTNWYVTQSPDFFLDNPRMLYPGQIVELYAKDPVADLHNVSVFATGTVTNVGICPEMSNYQIKVTGEMHNDLKVQDLTPYFDDLGDCGIPEIFWFGDINNDLYPDIVFVSRGEKGFAFTFFASDTMNKKVLYRKADQWFNYNCE